MTDPWMEDWLYGGVWDRDEAEGKDTANHLLFKYTIDTITSDSYLVLNNQNRQRYYLCAVHSYRSRKSAVDGDEAGWILVDGDGVRNEVG